MNSLTKSHLWAGQAASRTSYRQAAPGRFKTVSLTAYSAARPYASSHERAVDARESSALRIAVIDGPYDASALSGVLAQMPTSFGDGHCGVNPGGACNHGTFIMGLLGAGRDAPIPGLCADCQLMHIPIFVDEHAAQASVGDLAAAITLAVISGARLINLSLAILGDDSEHNHELARSLDCAEASGVLIIVAAGNQGSLATTQLLSHSATVPVVAVDTEGRLLPDCNFGPSISLRGVAALGHNVRGYAPGGGLALMSGTSVATAVATGIIAQVWSARPDADAGDIRLAVARLGPRNLSAVPRLKPDVLLMTLDRLGGFPAVITSPARYGSAKQVSLQGEVAMSVGHGLPSSPIQTSASFPAQAATLANGPGGCACDPTGGICTCNGNQARRSGYVYAIGTVEVEYPNVAIEREMQALAQHMGIEIAFDTEMPMKPTEDRSWQHAVLTRDPKMTRYLARQLSWRLTIEDLPAFVLNPRDPADFEDLIGCLARPKFPKRESGKRKRGGKATSESANRMFGHPEDLDVIIGVAGSQTPGGTQVTVDQVFNIKSDQLILPGTGGSYFEQLADSRGLTDEDRAYNYLMARYAISSENLDELNKEFEIAGVPAVYSRLGGDSRRIVRVIYTFNGKSPDAPAQRRYFVRVDVTDEFPFIVTPWNRYLERGEQL